MPRGATCSVAGGECAQRGTRKSLENPAALPSYACTHPHEKEAVSTRACRAEHVRVKGDARIASSETTKQSQHRIQILNKAKHKLLPSSNFKTGTQKPKHYCSTTVTPSTCRHMCVRPFMSAGAATVSPSPKVCVCVCACGRHTAQGIYVHDSAAHYCM